MNLTEQLIKRIISKLNIAEQEINLGMSLDDKLIKEIMEVEVC